jgi:hypothetical protein
MDVEKKNMEIDSLWHYAFFDRIDALHKYYDTMHNLSDVNKMSSEKKDSYILRRIPKLNALAFVMQKYSMGNYLDSIKRKWQEIG